MGTDFRMRAQEIDNQRIDFRKLLDKSLRVFFWDAMKSTLRNPGQAYFFYRTVRWQQQAARHRTEWYKRGVRVPPIMIFSITNRCNLHCKGCYHRALQRISKPEMSPEKLRAVFSEASALGISFCVLAGGEPLVRKEIIGIIRDFPKILFLVFTNGLLIDEGVLTNIRGQHNFIPVISMEGYENSTDGRRGIGVYRKLLRVIEEIKGQGLFWSVSLTVTAQNFEGLTDKGFVKTLVDMGCKLFFFLEYTPIQPGTEDWVLTEEQRTKLLDIRDTFRSMFNALFITVPGDEEEIGGCLSAGKGFIHISAEGDVEPCPFAPYSDTNLRESTLKEALQSDFLRKIRENHQHLNETEGGCALWIKREWVRSMLHGEAID
jgi:MoaA/NifB/PqqE/SkfB family radical SAM enzyme